jgi:cellulose synthase/poly-beta-1,6-N-acetylglucosamine synthase-like glycosyltransferase
MLSWFVFLSLVIITVINSVFPFIGSLIPYRFKEDRKYTPKISVIIPSRNEEMMIGKVIEAWTKVDYPKDKIEIICVDNSTDGTPAIIKKYAKKYGIVKYFAGKTKSKLGAVLFAIKKTKNPVILISDSDVLVSPACVRESVKYLVDERVGAVFGKRTPVNYRRSIFSRWDALRLLKTFVNQKFLTWLDSSVYFSASPCAMRKKDIIDIPENDELIADDLYMALYIRRKGLKVVFNRLVEGKVGVLQHMKEVFVRNPRGAKGTAEIALKGYDGMLGRRKYGRFGLFIIPYVEFMYLSSIVLYSLLFITLIADVLISTLTGALPVLLSYLGNLVVLWYSVMLFRVFLFTLIVFFVIKHKDRTFFLVMFLDPLIGFVNMIAAFSGFYSYLFGRKVVWKKTTTDREIR